MRVSLEGVTVLLRSHSVLWAWALINGKEVCSFGGVFSSKGEYLTEEPFVSKHSQTEM